MNHEDIERDLQARLMAAQDEVAKLEKALKALRQPGMEELFAVLGPSMGNGQAGPILTVKRETRPREPQPLRGRKEGRSAKVLEAMPLGKPINSMQMEKLVDMDAMSIRGAFTVLMGKALIERAEQAGYYIKRREGTL